MTYLRRNLSHVQQRIAGACAAAGRDPESVRLLAVSKTFGEEQIRAAAQAGQTRFGENYLQEALEKQAALADLALEWHFIGPVQSNKTRDLAANFAWVHGVERPKIAQRLAQSRPASLGPLNVCVQVNISGESSKSGCAPEQALELCREIARLAPLRLRGLMAIPAPQSPHADPRAAYRALHRLFDQIRAAGLPLDTLSAGMSDDLEAAIAEGATLVRVGSAIFGDRQTSKSRHEPG